MKGLIMTEASWSQQDDLPTFTNALTNPDHSESLTFCYF